MTRPAPPFSARSVYSVILRAFPSKSPTVGLIWARAIFTVLSLAIAGLYHALPNKLGDDRVFPGADGSGAKRKGVAFEFVVAHFRAPHPIGKQAGFDVM